MQLLNYESLRSCFFSLLVQMIAVRQRQINITVKYILHVICIYLKKKNFFGMGRVHIYTEGLHQQFSHIAGTNAFKFVKLMHQHPVGLSTSSVESLHTIKTPLEISLYGTDLS